MAPWRAWTGANNANWSEPRPCGCNGTRNNVSAARVLMSWALPAPRRTRYGFAMPGGLFDDLEPRPSFCRLTTRGRRWLWRWLRCRVPGQVFCRKNDAFARLVGINAKYRGDRDEHAVSNATETGTESDFVIAQAQAMGGAPTAVENDFAVTDKSPRNLHTSKLRIDHQVGRETAIAYPLMQCPQQIRATRTTGRRSRHLNRGRYRRPRRTPSAPRWSGWPGTKPWRTDAARNASRLHRNRPVRYPAWADATTAPTRPRQRS